MIGFFEHQYLSYKKRHLGNLVSMAKADGHLHESEIEFIYQIGRKFRLKDHQIQSVIEDYSESPYFMPANYDELLDQLHDIVWIMMADGVVDENEYALCEHLADNAGFNKDVVQEIVNLIHLGKPAYDDWEAFKQKALETMVR